MSTFDRIIGYETIKTELGRIVDMIHNKEIYASLGAKMPRGLLLYGAPGLGKTLMAKCLMEESGLKTYTIRRNKGSDGFVKEITETFKKKKENAPSIVFPATSIGTATTSGLVLVESPDKMDIISPYDTSISIGVISLITILGFSSTGFVFNTLSIILRACVPSAGRISGYSAISSNVMLLFLARTWSLATIAQSLSSNRL